MLQAELVQACSSGKLGINALLEFLKYVAEQSLAKS